MTPKEAIDVAASLLERERPDVAEALRSIRLGRPKDDGHLERLLSVRARMLERIDGGEAEEDVLRSTAARFNGDVKMWRNVLHVRRADVRRALKMLGT